MFNPVDDPDSAESNRRAFLRTLGATGSIAALGALGVDAVAAADVENMTDAERARVDRKMAAAKRPYGTQNAAIAAIRAHGKPVMDLLAADGVLTDPSLAGFDTTLRTASEALEAGTGLRVKAVVRDGVASAFIYTTRYTDDGRFVVLGVQPAFDRAYAIVRESRDAETSTVYDPAREDPVAQGISGDFCHYENGDSNPCWLQCELQSFECVYGDCYIGETKGCCDNQTCYTDCSAFC